MLVRLFYVSTAVGPQTTTVTSMLLEHSQLSNKTANITGVLGQGRGLYLQVLEGPRSAVNGLYQKICQDPRHKRIEILTYEHIVERRFSQWSMALIDLSHEDSIKPMKYSDFDPYGVSDVSMTLNLVELLARKIPIQ